MAANNPLTALLKRPIAFHGIFARLRTEDGKRLGVAAAVMLSQAVYWTLRTKDGWFYKTIEEWEQETGLTRWEQSTARRNLRNTKFWQEERRDRPARMYFYVDLDALLEAIEEQMKAESEAENVKDADQPKNVESQQCGDPTMLENHKAVCGDTTNYIDRNAESTRIKGKARETSDDVSRGGNSPARQSSDENPSVQEKPKRRKRGNDERLKHPAIQAWARASGIKPWRLNKVQRDMIIERVRDAPDTIALWETSVRHWFEHGWNPVNLRGQIEFFENGGPDRCKACQRQQHHRGGRNGRTPWLPAAEDPAWIDDEENLRRARELGYIDEHGNLLIELG